jgi:hypothetical protein
MARTKVKQEITLISITTDGRQLTGSGYTSFEEVQRKVRERLELQKNYPDTATRYDRFVMVASTSGSVNGVHVLDEKGRPLFERFLP